MRAEEGVSGPKCKLGGHTTITKKKKKSTEIDSI